MATRFLPIELQNANLFGVRLSGGVGRTDKANLLDMVEKCLSNGKVNLVLDLSELTSIGGGGARILADFQAELQKHNGEAVFVGASAVVRKFLGPKFADLPLRYFVTVDDANQYFYKDSYDYVSELAAAELKTSPSPEDPVAPEADGDDEQEIGAIGFMDDAEEMIPDGNELLVEEDLLANEDPENPQLPKPDVSPAASEGAAAVNDVLEEFNGPSKDEKVVEKESRTKK